MRQEEQQVQGWLSFGANLLGRRMEQSYFFFLEGCARGQVMQGGSRVEAVEE